MIRKNIIANYLGRAWGVVSVYLFIPFYIKFLGMEAYGLVGFYSLLLGVLAFADLGFTATLKREMARLSVQSDSSREMRDTVRTYELSYALISAVLSALVWLLAPLIAGKWLHMGSLGVKETATAIRLMGIAVSLQMPSGLYIGGLAGLEKQVLANSIQIAWGFVRGVGAVLILWLVSPTITAFALWQLFSNAAYCLAARSGLQKSIPAAGPGLFRINVFQTTWRYAAGMLGMSAISTLLTQADKIVVSKMLPLEMLGYYTLAGTLGSAPRLFAGPVVSAVFPRMTGLATLGDKARLSHLYHRTCELVALAVIPAGLTLAIFSREFIFAWTGSVESSQRAGLVASLLIGGQIIQELLAVPYNLALAHGVVDLNLKLGVASVIFIIPVLTLLVMKFGILGAGISWLAMNVLTIGPYVVAVHRRFLPGEHGRWLKRGLAVPVALSALLGLGCSLVLPQGGSRLLTFVKLGFVWAMICAMSLLASPVLRRGARDEVTRLRGKPLIWPGGRRRGPL